MNNNKTSHQFNVRQLMQIVIVFFVFILTVGAQDNRYSYFNGNQLYLNPAKSGDYQGDWRLSLNYRNQGMKSNLSYVSQSVSYEQHFYLFGREFGAGLLVLNDEAASVFTINRVNLSLANEFNISNQLIRIGIQAGVITKDIEDKFTYNSQFDRNTGGFNPDLPSNVDEVSGIVNIDFNVGAQWHTKIKSFEPVIGFSSSHINKPIDSFYGEKIRELIKHIVYAEIGYDVNSALKLEPNMYFMNQGKSTYLLTGLNGIFKITDKKSVVKNIYGGIGYAQGLSESLSSINLNTGARIRRLDIIIDYDYFIGANDKALTNTNAIEIHLIYRSISTVLNSYSIPCDRY